MTDIAHTFRESISGLKSKEWIVYVYFIFSLGIIYGLFFHQLNAIVIDWFADGNYTTKGPFVWLIALVLALLSIQKNQLKSSISINDLIFLLILISVIALVKDIQTVIIPTILFSAITYFGARIKELPEIFIVWLFLIFTLNYFPLLTPYLINMSVWANESLLALFGVPVLVQESFIAIPRGQFEVEGSCSGFRYLANNLILLFLYALMSKFNIRQFLLALSLTVLYSLLINWIRIFIIIVVAHNWGFEVPFFVKDHGNLGWVIYVFFLVLFFYTLIKIDKIKFAPSRLILFGEHKILSLPRIGLLLPLFVFSTI